MSAAGILLAYQSETGWEICLARRAIMPGIGKWLGAGGTIKSGEPPLTTALRETGEEWCGGRGRDVMKHFAEFNPSIPNDSPTSMYQHCLGDWSFYTFLVQVTKRFPVEHVQLDSESYRPARWFSADELRELYDQHLLKRTVFCAAQHFQLL